MLHYFCSLTMNVVGRINSRLQKHEVRLRRLNPFFLIAGICMACFVCITASLAQMIITTNENERDFLRTFLSKGTNPLDIRASAIRDKILIVAIQRGAKTRQIRLLLDKSSPEIKALAGQKNIQVRLASAKGRGKFGKSRLSQSLVLERGQGYYQFWHGPLIWTKRAFGKETEFFAESGLGPGGAAPKDAKTFEHDFSLGALVKR